MEILYAIFSAVGFATVGFGIKTLVTKSKSYLLSAFWFQILAALFFVPLFLIESPKWDASRESLLLLVFSILCYFAFTVLLFKSMEHLDISINGILSQATLIFTFIGSLVLFDEKATVEKLIGVGLILTGNIFLFLRKNAFKDIKLRGVILRAAASIMLAAALLADAENSHNFSVTYYGFLEYLFPGLLFLPYVRPTLKSLKKEFMDNKLGLLVIGAAGAFSYYFLIKSFIELDKTVAVPINNSSSVILVLMGIVLLKEKKDIKRKLIAAGLVFGGVVLLGLA